MDELVRWLGEQLDEDERIAKRAATMKFDLPSDAPWERARLLIEQRRAAADERHIAAHDPARVLREIEAKRKILVGHAKAVGQVEELSAVRERAAAQKRDTFMTDMELGSAIQRRDVLYGVVQIHALAYADRPGYRAEEWSP